MSAPAFALRPHPAGQPGSDAARKRIKAVQACRRQVAGLEDDTAWRAFLGRVAGGQTSLRAMGYRDLGRVLDALHAAGAPRRDGGAWRSRYADDLQMRMIRGLWIEAADAGVVSDRSETALGAFIRRQTGQDLGALSAGKARAVIEALKAMVKRGPKAAR
jgi:phage gp16-like protein